MKRFIGLMLIGILLTAVCAAAADELFSENENSMALTMAAADLEKLEAAESDDETAYTVLINLNGKPFSGTIARGNAMDFDRPQDASAPDVQGPQGTRPDGVKPITYRLDFEADGKAVAYSLDLMPEMVDGERPEPPQGGAMPQGQPPAGMPEPPRDGAMPQGQPPADMPERPTRVETSLSINGADKGNAFIREIDLTAAQTQ